MKKNDSYYEDLAKKVCEEFFKDYEQHDFKLNTIKEGLMDARYLIKCLLQVTYHRLTEKELMLLRKEAMDWEKRYGKKS